MKIISKRQKLRGLLRLVILITILINLEHCSLEQQCQFESIIPVLNSDSLKPGEEFQAELKIPYFDSTIGYQCILGDYDTIIDDQGCRFSIDSVSNYIRIAEPISFKKIGAYYIISESESLGIREFKGYITYRDKNGNEKFYPFECFYTVYVD